MKKLLTYLMVSVFALSVLIVGRPITQGQNKGEDFFIVDIEDTVDIGGFWMKNGNVVGFGTMTKEKATELFKKWNLQQRKTKTEI